MGLHSLLLQHLCPAVKEHIRRSIICLLCDHPKWCFWMETCLEDEGYESGSERLNIPTPLCRAPCLYYISASDNLSFGPTTPLRHQTYSTQCPSNLNAMCHYLMFDDDDDSSIDSSPLQGRSEQSSPVEPNGSPPHRWFLPGHHQWSSRRTLPNSSIRWWCLDGRTNPRQTLMHPWTVKTSWLVPLPLPIQLGSTTPCSSIHISTAVHGPKWHLWFPRCDDSDKDIPSLEDVFAATCIFIKLGTSISVEHYMNLRTLWTWMVEQFIHTWEYLSTVVNE